MPWCGDGRRSHYTHTHTLSPSLYSACYLRVIRLITFDATHHSSSPELASPKYGLRWPGSADDSDRQWSSSPVRGATGTMYHTVGPRSAHRTPRSSSRTACSLTLRRTDRQEPYKQKTRVPSPALQATKIAEECRSSSTHRKRI